jgi:hypothetical protein
MSDSPWLLFPRHGELARDLSSSPKVWVLADADDTGRKLSAAASIAVTRASGDLEIESIKYLFRRF